MKSKKAQEVSMNKKGDSYLKDALLQAQGLMEEQSKISDKLIRLEQSEDRYTGFLEGYLSLSGFLCAIAAITAVLLAFFYPPTFVRVALAKHEGGGLWWLTVLYLSSVGILSVVCVFSLSGALCGIEAIVYANYTRKFDRELIRWTQSTNHKQKSQYIFERLKSEYGYRFWGDQKFYEAAKEKFLSILAEISEPITQEEINRIVAEEIIIAQKQRNTDALIIACYLARYKSFESLKKALFA